ncbi:MFS transporter [Streptomyces sp. LHD-70]|uniref:MFS transporter n=1 Tax=Streptomyces sp. LHD-70 TaxID=3072140 RepID=UPI0028106E9C|nr:MFS transporter [Streptomyces sp. LHD-70]MDQ8703972.1 MFS transporter [Streptomyces sp. LHD-70]
MTELKVSWGRGLPTESADRDRGAVRTAALLLIVLTAGAYLPSPLYPDYQRLFGYGDLTMTLLFATFALVSGPALLLCGPAADTLGPRPLLRLSVLLAAAGSACFLLADSPALLFAGRVGQALALGAATGAAQALIVWHRSTAARIGGPLLVSLAFAGGTALGPAVSGALARYVSGPLVTPFILHLALLAWVWTRLGRAVPPTATGPGTRRPRLARPRIPAALRPLFLVAGFNGFLAWAVVGIYLALVPALLERSLHSNNPALSGGVLAAVLGWSLIAQLAAARWSTWTTQRVGVAALTVSLLLLAVTGATSLPATIGSALLAGAGHGLAFSGATGAVDARTPVGHRGGVGSALHLLFYLGSGTPAVAVGLMTACMPLTAAVTTLSWTAAALGTLALALTYGLISRERRAIRPDCPLGTPAPANSVACP